MPFPLVRVRTAVARLLEKGGEDPMVLDAALSGIRGTEPAVLERVAGANATEASGRDAALIMLTATIVRSGQDAAMQQFLAAVSDEARPAAVVARSCAAPKSRCSVFRRPGSGWPAWRSPQPPVSRARPVPAGVRARAVRMRFQEPGSRAGRGRRAP